MAIYPIKCKQCGEEVAEGGLFMREYLKVVRSFKVTLSNDEPHFTIDNEQVEDEDVDDNAFFHYRSADGKCCEGGLTIPDLPEGDCQ